MEGRATSKGSYRGSSVSSNCTANIILNTNVRLSVINVIDNRFIWI